jgi:hypothetical protein
VQCVTLCFIAGDKSDVFTCAKMMLLTSFVMMLLPMVASDVMFAHCAEGTTSQPKATSQGEADIT